MRSLGNSIRRSRVDAQLSVNDLAACLEVDPATLASWEHDLETPVRENLLRLSLQFPDLLVVFQEDE